MSQSQHPTPPKWIDQFLEWFCSKRLVEEIQGDLYEGFYYRSNKNKSSANWWYFFNVLRFFKPSSFGQYQSNSNTVAMHNNYFKTALRNFAKNKVYSSINLMGLILGTTCCLLISLHVLEEFSYDNFHADTPNTYRVVMDMYNNGELSIKSAPVYPAVGPGLKDEWPEVLDYTRILPFGDGVYSVKAQNGSLIRFNEENGVFADPNFFKIFGFELLKGNPEEVLNGIDQTVISESTAKRYFGDRDPIGLTITYRGTQENIITGVMADFPENSHMKFDIITSLMSWDGYEEWPSNWGWYDFYTFIQVQPGTLHSNLRDKLKTYMDSKKGEIYEKDGSREVLTPQALADIHLFSKGYSWEMGENGGSQNVYFLSAIALMILIIAWVNFVNLSTARAVKRAREVGIRKVVGAKRWHLIQQFLLEALLFNLFAILVGVILVLIAAPTVERALDVSLETALLLDPRVLGGFAGLLSVGTLITGFYPAMVLSTFKPLNVLKGRFYSRKRAFGFRQVLVVFQFTISIILILGTMVVIKQLRFMQDQDIGLNVDQTLVLKAPSSSRGEGDLAGRLEVFSTKVRQLSDVKGFTKSNTVPGQENFSISSFATRRDPNVYRDIYRVRVDENFFPDFEIEVLAGRNFIKDMASDSNATLINRTALKMFGFLNPEDAVGEILNPGPRSWKIVGVVEDYHHSSLKEALDPIIFTYRNHRGSFYSVKLDQGDEMMTVGSIEEIWNEVYPDNPFDFFFLDEFFDRQYKSDQQFNTVFMGFAAFAIIVAGMGLFGLVSFILEQSRKEIGIRKVLGASIQRVVLLFAKDYALLVLIAMVLAFPTGYYLMRSWLQDFAYQTEIGPAVFITGGLIILIITFATVSIKSVGAANANPVDALRDE